MSAQTPQPTRCPQCGSMDCGPIRCRFSMREHVRRPEEQPAPAEGYYDIWEEIKRAQEILYPSGAGRKSGGV